MGNASGRENSTSPEPASAQVRQDVGRKPELTPSSINRSNRPPVLQDVVFHLPKDPSIQTRHIAVYNTGPAVGVDESTLLRVFQEYGPVERVICPNPSSARVLVTFTDVASAVRAKAERNRPPEIEEKVRLGVARAAMASDVFAPKPGEPCPLLGRWLKVTFADVRARSNPAENQQRSMGKAAHTSTPNFLTDFKALDALSAGGASSRDARPTPCPLCGRSCGGQRGLRMHLVGAHPLEIRSREYFVELLKQASRSLPRGPSPSEHSDRDADNTADVLGREDYSHSADGVDAPPNKAGSGAAAKGRASSDLSSPFTAARTGDLVTLRRMVESGWDPKTATDKNGSSPLDWAAGEGRIAVCRYLLEECGVDPGRACPARGRSEGRTALHWAARGGHDEVCSLLLGTPRPANCSLRPGQDAASDPATAYNYLSPDVPAAEGTTPFHWAAWGAHASTCQLLFDRGVDHRRVNSYGCNVAHWCGLSGDVEVCRCQILNDGDADEGWSGVLLFLWIAWASAAHAMQFRHCPDEEFWLSVPGPDNKPRLGESFDVPILDDNFDDELGAKEGG